MTRLVAISNRVSVPRKGATPGGLAVGVLAAMRADPLGADAAIIGQCVEAHPGMVVTKTAFGATRVVDTPIGEQLPRIC